MSNDTKKEEEKLSAFYPKNKTPIVKFRIIRSYNEVKGTDISAKITIEYDPEWHVVKLIQKGWDGIETEESYYPKEIKKIAMLLLAMDRVLKDEVNLSDLED